MSQVIQKTHSSIMNIHKMTLVYPALKLLISKTSDPDCGRDHRPPHFSLSYLLDEGPPSTRSRRILSVKALGARYATRHGRSITPPYLGPRSTGTRSVEPAQVYVCGMLRCEGRSILQVENVALDVLQSVWNGVMGHLRICDLCQTNYVDNVQRVNRTDLSMYF